jgi:hypothetical protein
MALVCIKAGEGSSDPTGYQQYDIIEVLEDGQDPGACVCLPDFLVIMVDGSREDNLYLKNTAYNDDAQTIDVKDKNGNPVLKPDGTQLQTTTPATVANLRDHFYNFDTQMDAAVLSSIKNSTSKQLQLVTIDASMFQQKSAAGVGKMSPPVRLG